MAIGLSVQVPFVFMLVSHTYFALYAFSSFFMSISSNSVDFVFIIVLLVGFEPTSRIGTGF